VVRAASVRDTQRSEMRYTMSTLTIPGMPALPAIPRRHHGRPDLSEYADAVIQAELIITGNGIADAEADR